VTEESQLGPSVDGTVVLDIGGDIGALIILTGAELLRAELEISPVSDDAEDVFQAGDAHEHTHDGHTHSHTHDAGGPRRTHVAVRERHGPSGVRYAAIYPQLREGEYTIYGTDGEPAETVRITGGEVAQLDWR
jgi:hypothetical protein